MMLSVVLVASMLFGVGTSHLCMITPPQRGSIVGINQAGAPNCILLKSPCGGRNTGPILELIAGQTYTVNLLKNLSHFNKANPGNFTISIAHVDGPFKSLTSFPDDSEPSLSLYSTNVTMPKDMGEMVLQSVYYTNNAKAPAAFYQCSDLRLVSKH